MNMKHRRYFPNILSICVLWENASSSLYKQIRDEGLLTIPSTRYIKKLSSALSVETGLSEDIVNYLETRCQKLHNREKIGSFIFQEIYTAKGFELSRSNGQIYGMSNEQPTKALLSMMFKSIASKYDDVVAMVSLAKVDSSILRKLFNNVMNADNHYRL